ncbi:MAG: hypothetical protein JWQ89_621 [Devosia sp.]|uniref:DUF5681 domain-containing protein n=1 Tax=Devosia sp. TaxID=1871048 RepID=UPI0026068860|nr:DUF5681 domain-containing protein [Devosia sp.]MDB5538894.1 hypothetical protein [Devosia sp.]
MSKHPQDGGKPMASKGLSKEAVEAAKSEILHGTGYKRPPQHSRFKKGQSGNPKGRPKAQDLGMGQRSSSALALNEAERLITVREGDKVHQIPAIEAVHRAQYASATKGNAHAQKHIIENYKQADRARRQEIRENNEWWAGYVRRGREAHAYAAENGLPVPPSLPHPDDVVIDSERGVRFSGPFDDVSAENFRNTVRLRDVLIMQDALQQREVEQAGHGEHGTALACVMLLDRGFPERFRLSESDWTMRMLRLEGVTKRELRRRLTHDWAALGVDWHPDSRLPTLSKFLAMLDQLMEAVAELEREDKG